MNKEQTCEERIKKEFEDRLGDFIYAVECTEEGKPIIIDDFEYEDFLDWLNQYALAYDNDPHYRARRLELSYGGPQDYFLFFKDGAIEYHFLNWFDGATLDVSHNKTMKWVAEYLAEIPLSDDKE